MLGDAGLWAARLEGCGMRAIGTWDEGMLVVGCKDAGVRGHWL